MYVEVGAASTPLPAPVKWKLYVYVERRIQCVPVVPGTPRIEDEQPEFPDPDRPWDSPPEQPEPEEPGAPPAPPKPGLTEGKHRHARLVSHPSWRIIAATIKGTSAPSRPKSTRSRR